MKIYDNDKALYEFIKNEPLSVLPINPWIYCLPDTSVYHMLSVNRVAHIGGIRNGKSKVLQDGMDALIDKYPAEL